MEEKVYSVLRRMMYQHGYLFFDSDSEELLAFTDAY